MKKKTKYIRGRYKILSIGILMFTAIAAMVSIFSVKSAASESKKGNCILGSAKAVTTITSYNQRNDKVASGSGFIYKVSENDGLVATNYHVTTGNIDKNKFLIRFNNGKVVQGSLYSYDLNFDLALIRANTKVADSNPIKFDNSSDIVTIGDPVYTVSSPRESINNISEGILSGTHRPSIYSPEEEKDDQKNNNNNTIDTSHTSIIDAMETDAAISNGSSGGVVFKKDCTAIGVIFGGEADPISKANIAGMNFFIPGYIAGRTLEKLEAKTAAQHGSLGLVIDESRNIVAAISKSEKKVLDSNGAAVKRIENEDLKKSGLREGDIIVNYNGENVDSQYQLLAFIFSSLPGEKINLRYYRPSDGVKYNTITVTIASNLTDTAVM